MKNKLSIYEKILAEYENTRNENEKFLLEKIEHIYKEIPLIKEIDENINKKAISAGLDLLRGKDSNYKEELSELKDAKIAQLLIHGYDENFLEPSYNCLKCKDTGFISSEECTCFKQRLAKEYYKMSNLEKSLQRENFETFDFGVFSEEIIPEEDNSPREKISEIRRASEKFIRNFEDEDEFNLLFFGTTGLGKTFMLNCIAKELLDLGYTVVYQTSHNILGIIEEYKFNKTENIVEAKKKYDYLLESDLLIIDDLGTESSNSFTNSEIFNIINSRNLENKKMLISTNLTPAEIAKTYTDRIYSRILDRFYLYKFIGRDLRWL